MDKKNYEHFINVINHYKEIWTLNKNNSHGDLSLENILFRNNEVILLTGTFFKSCSYRDLYLLSALRNFMVN